MVERQCDHNADARDRHHPPRRLVGLGKCPDAPIQGLPLATDLFVYRSTERNR